MGSEIENEIAVVSVTPQAEAKFSRLLALHRGWLVRKPPTAIYNCFGQVWACRRTAVYDKFDEAVLRVRADDGYRIVGAQEIPLPGDVACYWEGTNPYRNCIHLGVVAFLKERAGLSPSIFVLSKWDDMSGEVLHDSLDYPTSFGTVTLEFWTDRPPV